MADQNNDYFFKDIVKLPFLIGIGRNFRKNCS